MRRTVMMMTAVIGVLLGLHVDAQPPGAGRGRGPGPGGAGELPALVEELNLSGEQEKAWDAIRSELDETTRMTRARLRELREQGADPEDEEVARVRREMQKAVSNAESDLLDILDEGQKERYRELKKEAQSERGRGRGSGGRRGGPGRSF